MNETGKSVTIVNGKKHVVCPIYLDVRKRSGYQRLSSDINWENGNWFVEFHIFDTFHKEDGDSITIPIKRNQRSVVLESSMIDPFYQVTEISILCATDVVYTDKIKPVSVMPVSSVKFSLEGLWQNFP